MEITPLMIYLIGIADNVTFFLGIVTRFGGVVGALYLFCSLDGDYEIDWKLVKRFLIPYIIFVFLLIITPSSKTLAAMYIIPPIANNQTVQELPKEVLNFVKEYLKDQRDDSDI